MTNSTTSVVPGCGGILAFNVMNIEVDNVVRLVEAEIQQFIVNTVEKIVISYVRLVASHPYKVSQLSFAKNLQHSPLLGSFTVVYY